MFYDTHIFFCSFFPRRTNKFVVTLFVALSLSFFLPRKKKKKKKKKKKRERPGPL